MAVSETTAAPAGTAADAVRALLGVLGAPALGQALVLEKALAGFGEIAVAVA
jgi:molybdopterin/thiamine biosynthesis adenylyltransferase